MASPKPSTSNPRRGYFITLEGGEGAGKSSQARAIVHWLRERGRSVVLTREPGGSPLAEATRALVLQTWPGEMTAQTETLLMFAARDAHLHHTILPALNAGKDVVCDRFIDSTYAYQGAGKGLPVADIARLEKLVLGRFKPDLTLVLDLPPDQGLARAHARGEVNRFEAETLAFARRVRRCFLARAVTARRYAVIRAEGSLMEVHERIRKVLEQRL